MTGTRSGSAEAPGDRSIAAAGSIRQALTGDGAVAYYTEKSLTLPPEALELPPQAPPNMVNLPRRAGLFVGRQPELRWLAEAFGSTRGVVVQAVHGLGGIGKSTLAAKWAAGRVESYNPVWWITAGTPVELESGLADLAVALQPALRDVLSQEALSERAVQWLAANEGWLLVLDNVSDPADVRPLLGRTTGGRFLITTRRATGWHGIAEPLPLDVLEPTEAIELFERIHGGTVEGVEELCGELGWLPLAVEQAAAYCAEAGISPRAYGKLLARYPERVFANTAEGGDSERTIARVWRVTMDRLADTPLAETILRVIAWWAPDGIPRRYVESLGDELAVTEALRRLAAHSMVNLREDGTISVHRLVQAVSRVGEGGDSACDEAAFLLLGRAEMLDSPVWITHAEALAAHAGGDTASLSVLLLALGIGNWHVVRLSLGRAGETFEAAMTAADRVLGGQNEVTLLARQSLARCCWEVGEYDRAQRLLAETLAVAGVVFGPKAPQTIDAHNALTELKLKLDDLDSGLSLAVENVRRAERALGGDAPQTCRARAVLALAWQMMARSDPDRHSVRAATEIERLLAQTIESHGVSSEWTLQLMCELSEVRDAAGDVAGAIRLIEEYIEKRPVPPDSVDVRGLLARRRLVALLCKAGDIQRARVLAKPLVAEMEQVYDSNAMGQLRDSLPFLLTQADDT